MPKSNNMRALYSSVVFIAVAPPAARAFAPHRRSPTLLSRTANLQRLVLASASADSDTDADSDTNKEENRYADPAYPELEFINYDDPNYQVDQGTGDEFFDPNDNNDAATLAEIEAMREERRLKNDEFQFETYHAKGLRGGDVALGEWTVYSTDTFLGADVVAERNPEAASVPRLSKRKPLKVVSRGRKVVLDAEAAWRVDGERILHEERLAESQDFPHRVLMNDGDDDHDSDSLAWDDEDRALVTNTYWPQEMTSLDFRGPAGNMCVGNAYTVCSTIKLNAESQESESEHDGPFREMQTEIGVADDGMRFRIKLDYAILEDDTADASSTTTPPPLHLRTLIVCRETLDGYWPSPDDNGNIGGDYPTSDDKEKERPPRNDEHIASSLFGPPGAQGGLYDPPPVGNEERANKNYILLDFEGGATVLLPHRVDQAVEDGEESGSGGRGGIGAVSTQGWVTTLDWTPGAIRYQVDRKVWGGKEIKGLRTLELSEVQGQEADRWRPKDGGENMRQ